MRKFDGFLESFLSKGWMLLLNLAFADSIVSIRVISEEANGFCEVFPAHANSPLFAMSLERVCTHGVQTEESEVPTPRSRLCRVVSSSLRSRS
jgi:hypothetical protein